jgi:filamin
MKSRMDGTYACSYTPVKAIKHTIAVVWGGVNIPHSPYRVSCEVNPGCMTQPNLVPGLGSVEDIWKDPILGGP